jgi:serine/threonine protein kinase
VTLSLSPCTVSVVQTHGSLYLVMELVTGGELFDNLIQSGAFPE